MKAVPMTVVDHVCGVCFARILSMETDAGRQYCCITCGQRELGRTPAVICACGIKTPKGKDAGFRCVANPERTPDCPFEVVAKQS